MPYHTPVLLQEVMSHLQPHSGGLYLDGTVGGGGHAAELLRRSAPDGRVIGLDWDEEAIAESRERLAEFGARVTLVRANFAELENVLMSIGVTAVQGVLFDLGVSSRQFDEPSRGFSFQREGALDMRMSRDLGATARDIVGNASVEELTRVFTVYGEERRARAIARTIESERRRAAIETTTRLAEVVERVSPRGGKIHPATRVFQALRIAVNNELENLRHGLGAVLRILGTGGRIAVISFHSLEDRIVKQFFRETPELRVITKKPIRAGDAELRANPRARSAKLRIAEKI
jgi:16S rRNA (cytosine1402-N4)-methyltransferase